MRPLHWIKSFIPRKQPKGAASTTVVYSDVPLYLIQGWVAAETFRTGKTWYCNGPSATGRIAARDQDGNSVELEIIQMPDGQWCIKPRDEVVP